MGRTPTPDTIQSQAAAGYLSPSAVVRRYGTRHGFGLKLVHKWIAEWRRAQWHVEGKTAVDADRSNVWALEAAVKQKLKERAGR
jgi:hypothetical protein